MPNFICTQCGNPVEGDATERIPCPKCGSMARTVQQLSSIGIAHSITTATALAENVQSVRAVSDLLVQAVIELGDKTAEGRLVEAVTMPWFEIIDWLKK
jgi:hypothetical protein